MEPGIDTADLFKFKTHFTSMAINYSAVAYNPVCLCLVGPVLQYYSSVSCFFNRTMTQTHLQAIQPLNEDECPNFWLVYFKKMNCDLYHASNMYPGKNRPDGYSLATVCSYLEKWQWWCVLPNKLERNFIRKAMSAASATMEHRKCKRQITFIL